MEPKKVLLTNGSVPKRDQTVGWMERLNPFSNPPLGLLYIAGILEQQGHCVEVLDFAPECMEQDAFIQKLQDLEPDVVGISAVTATYTFCSGIARVVREVLPKALVVFGGPFPSFRYEQVLAQEAVDCVVRFEGEQTMADLMSRLHNGHRPEYGDIPGIAYRENGTARCTPPRAVLRDLDTLPFPDRAKVPLTRYKEPYTLSTSRGCPGDCIFCSSRSYWGKEVRHRSLENILDEIEMLRHTFPDMKKFIIADDTFTSEPERVVEFCQRLERRNLGVTWGCFSRVDVFDERLAQHMRAAGCFQVKFGVESGSDEILGTLGKRTTTTMVEDAVAAAFKAGIPHIQASLILGLPDDTPSTMRATIDFAVHLAETYGVRGQVGLNTPFPGTPQCERASRFGLRIHTEEWDLYDSRHPIVSTENFTRTDLSALYYQAVEALYGRSYFEI